MCRNKYTIRKLCKWWNYFGLCSLYNNTKTVLGFLPIPSLGQWLQKYKMPHLLHIQLLVKKCLTDCTFTDCTFTDCTFINCRFTDCTFTYSTLTDWSPSQNLVVMGLSSHHATFEKLTWNLLLSQSKFFFFFCMFIAHWRPWTNSCQACLSIAPHLSWLSFFLV